MLCRPQCWGDIDSKLSNLPLYMLLFDEGFGVELSGSNDYLTPLLVVS